MKFLNNMKIGLRLNLILSLVMVIIISSLGIYTINSQKSKVYEDTDTRMFEQVNDLSKLIEIQTEKNQVNAQKALEIAKTLMESYGGINFVEDNNQDLDFGSQLEAGWYLNSNNVIDNYDFVDEVAGLTNAVVSIFEKHNAGYKRISTSLINEKGKREVGTNVPSSSVVSQTINNGQNYYGRAIVVDEWNLTAYSPITHDGTIVGMIGVGIKEKDLQGLKQIFKEKKYFDTGYPFMVDNKGTFIIHPTKEGQNSADAEFFKQLISSKEITGKTRYMWEGKMKYQYFKYVEPIESFVSVSIYEHELLGMVTKVRNAIMLAIVI